MVHGGPKVVHLTVDLHEHLVAVPPPLARSDAFDPALSDLGCRHRPEPMPPEPDRFVTDVDATFVEEIFDIAQRERKTDVQHHRQADDFGAGFEILERRAFGHLERLRKTPARLKPSSSDKTV